MEYIVVKVKNVEMDVKMKIGIGKFKEMKMINRFCGIYENRNDE